MPAQLNCPKCGAIYPLSLFMKTCSSCNSVLFAHYDRKTVAAWLEQTGREDQTPKLWKYHGLLPLGEGLEPISLGEGGTFLQSCNRLAKVFGIRKLYLKNETMNPTGSFIDRGVAVEVSCAVSEGIQEVQCAPTGNLGASLAAYAAKAGIRCILYVSPDVNPGKLLQMIAYDAQVRLSSAPSPEKVNNRSLWVTPVDPFILEGEKTVVFEICEQLGWRTPSRIIAPMGTGGFLSMLWKGLRELSQIGFVRENEVRLTGAQAAGCDPIIEAFKGNRCTVIPTQSAQTLAIDLKVARPPLGEKALEAIRMSRGTAVAVSDDEILEAARLLAKTEGVFAEPAAASTVAALKKIVESREINSSEDVVCIITGSGLKDPSATFRLIERQRKIRFLVERRRNRGLSLNLGETKAIVLQLLSKGETYGYEVWKRLAEEYGVRVKIPSVYQHLSDLEDLGLVERSKTLAVAGKPERRCYMLTTKGRETLTTLDRLRPA